MEMYVHDVAVQEMTMTMVQRAMQVVKRYKYLFILIMADMVHKAIAFIGKLKGNTENKTNAFAAV